MIITGCFCEEDNVPVLFEGENLPEPVKMLESNAEEADICVWRHVRQVPTTKILVVSIDSDVHIIGMALLMSLVRILS